MSALVNNVNYTPKMPSVKSRNLTVSVQPSNGHLLTSQISKFTLIFPPVNTVSISTSKQLI